MKPIQLTSNKTKHFMDALLLRVKIIYSIKKL